MATIYTNPNTAIEPFVARIYADGINVYDGFLTGSTFTPPHPLRSCTTFQWEYNDRINGWQDIAGAITDTYTVDVSEVANSGDYRCKISVGTSEDCIEYTDVRTVSIIDCGNTTVPTFPNAGGTETIAFDFPHYEANNIELIYPDWITENHIICAMPSANVCEEIVEITASQPPSNFARNGYFDVQIGEYLCSYAIQQDYAAAAPEPDPPAEAADPPPAGNLLLSVANPEVQVGSSTTMTASTYILMDDGTFDPNLQVSDVTWTVTDETGANYTNFSVAAAPLIPWIVATINVDTSVVAEKSYTVTATINGMTATRTGTTNVVAQPVVEANGVVSGDTYLTATARTLAIGGPNDAPRLDTSRNSFSGTFVVEAGTADMSLKFTDRGGLIQRYAYGGEAEFTYTIAGPSITGGSITRTVMLAAGPEPGPDFSYLAPETIPIPNELVVTAADVTDDGVFSRGTYTISARVVDPGTQPTTPQGGRRFWNVTFSPSINLLVNPIYNFFNLVL